MICKIDLGDKAREQIKSPNYVNSNFSTELRVSLNMDGVFGISNIIAILAPQMQGPCSFGINLHISHISHISQIRQVLKIRVLIYSTKVFGTKDFSSETNWLISQCQAKEKPAGGEGVAEIEEVGGKWHDWCEVWRMTLEHFGTIGRLKWPFGNPCDSIKFAPWVGMLPPKPEALPTQSIYLATLVRGRGTILKYI